jgi:low affinity Fe/Cu permease
VLLWNPSGSGALVAGQGNSWITSVPRNFGKKNGSKAAILIPSPKEPNTLSKAFGEVAKVTSREVGRAWVFTLALATVVVWALTGPYFDFSDTWQLVINTGTTIVTFLMVFLIQNSQNRDSAAIQVKLDELIRVTKARNSFIGLEHLTDEELEQVREMCERAKPDRTAASKTSTAERKF